MKKLYSAPVLRFINLDVEGMIAASVDSTLRVDGGASSNADNLLTEKKEQDLWGNEDIWK